MTQSPQSSETGPLFSKLENKRTNLTIRGSRTKITTKLNCPPDYFFLSKSNRNETNPQSYKTGLLFSKLESKRTNLTIRGSQTKITTKLCVLLILVISFFFSAKGIELVNLWQLLTTFGNYWQLVAICCNFWHLLATLAILATFYTLLQVLLDLWQLFAICGNFGQQF